MINSTAALSVVIGTFTVTVISKQTEVLNWIALVMTLLSGILTVLILPESPKLQLSHDEIHKAKLGLNYIARINQVGIDFSD